MKFRYVQDICEILILSHSLYRERLWNADIPISGAVVHKFVQQYLNPASTTCSVVSLFALSPSHPQVCSRSITRLRPAGSNMQQDFLRQHWEEYVTLQM